MELPIDEILPDLVSHLQSESALVLQAAPGAGKTTRVPSALLDAGFVKQGKIIMLEPRRIAAKSAAHHIAHLRNSGVPGAL